MKIITSTQAQGLKIMKSEYPKNKICQWCASEVQLESGKDITEVPAILVDEDSLKTGATVPGIGFVCPVCTGVNILG